MPPAATGQPEIVVCDGSWAIRNAAAWAFPKANIYPCAWHQFDRLRQHLLRAGLWNNRRLLYRLLRDEGRVLSDSTRWQQLEQVLRRYLSADRSKLSPQKADALAGLEKWLDRNGPLISTSAAAFYWPTTISHLEEHLDTIRSRLGDRRRAFRNLHRLNCVLHLFLMQLRGEASASSWTRVLRENHRSHRGKPPPRRRYDGQVIKPRP